MLAKAVSGSANLLKVDKVVWRLKGVLQGGLFLPPLPITLLIGVVLMNPFSDGLEWK